MPNPVLRKVCSLFIQLTLFIYQNPLRLRQRELQRKAVFSLMLRFNWNRARRSVNWVGFNGARY